MNNSVNPGRLVNSMRATVIGTAVVGIVLGSIALLWPGATLLTIAFFFGVSLIIAGLFRVFLGSRPTACRAEPVGCWAFSERWW